jgi:endonuclease/exonuclease/phosphatase family metal-dependent hydrolase
VAPVLRVATFNIRHGSAGPGRESDLVRLGVALVELDADVVGLQEVDRWAGRSGGVDQAAVLAAAAGADHHHGVAHLLPDGGRYGNAVLVRGRIERLEDLPLPGGGEPRAAVVALVSAGADGHRTTVVVTHLQHAGGQPRPTAEVQLEWLLERVAAVEGPLVVLADFNLPPSAVAPRARAVGLVAVDAPPGFPARRPNRTIDGVLVRGWDPVGVDVPPVTVSDHRPLVVDLAPTPRTIGDRDADHAP